MVDAVAVPGARRDVGAGSGPRGGAVRLVGLTKTFDGVTAVDGIDLDIAGGEFFSLLGPSGCGKTTTLRMVAGFERPGGGRILLDGEDMSAVPPHRRPVNTVFQNYALFPFLSVRDNVAFGLRYADLTKQDARRRCDEALALVRLEGLAGRRPHQLSGGQQQRVALARALVLSPRVLLLDEPLGALDAKLRRTLQLELKALQREVGITFVYVTHDQDEALTMSDRLAVMAGGRVEQVGTPADVYERPATAYVADFLGTANLVPVEVIGPHGPDRIAFRLDGEVLLAGPPDHSPGTALLVVRPENVRVRPQAGADGGGADGAARDNTLGSTVDRLVYRGALVELVVRTAGGTELVATLPAAEAAGFVAGQGVRVTIPPAAARLLPPGAPVSAR